MSKVALLAFARTASTRCPNKVLFDLGGKPAFIHIIERITSVIDPDYVLVACNRDARDDPIELFAKQYGIDCFRGGEDSRYRTIAAGHSLGLKNDDIILCSPCDGVLAVYKYIPYIVEQMDKYDCEVCLVDIPEGTLTWGLSYICQTYSFGFLVKTGQGVHTVEKSLLAPHAFHLGYHRIIRLKFPPEYLVLWPWGQLWLDWPSQACIIKEIYRQLYRESPIDVFDIYNLMRQQPYFASLIPTEFPEHPKDHSTGTGDFFGESRRLGMDIIELTWKGTKI